MDNIEPHSNVLCVAGGTGITYVLPILLQLVQSLRSVRAKFGLTWCIKEIRDLKWAETELKVLQQAPEDMNLDINIFVTQGITTKIESKGKEFHPTDIHVKDATSVETSGATNGRARSLCLRQSDEINGNRRPDVSK
ncbi:hypothetical protein Trisim1_009551 [Trichoderma cf. simile WF8]